MKIIGIILITVAFFIKAIGWCIYQLSLHKRILCIYTYQRGLDRYAASYGGAAITADIASLNEKLKKQGKYAKHITCIYPRMKNFYNPFLIW